MEPLSIASTAAGTVAPAAVDSASDCDVHASLVATTDTSKWPNWAKKAFNHFTAQSYGNEFAHAIRLWTELERSYGWETSVKGLSAKERPAAVGEWLRLCRRVHEKVPKLPTVDEYATSWWTWWVGLQPDWRATDGDDRPLMSGEGPWDDLVQPGQNGMLLVLISLVWWHGIMTDASRSAWEAAVREVGWVLEQMVRAGVEAPTKYVPFLVYSSRSYLYLCINRKRKAEASSTVGSKRARKN